MNLCAQAAHNSARHHEGGSLLAAVNRKRRGASQVSHTRHRTQEIGIQCASIFLLPITMVQRECRCTHLNVGFGVGSGCCSLSPGPVEGHGWTPNAQEASPGFDFEPASNSVEDRKREESYSYKNQMNYRIPSYREVKFYFSP